MKPEKELQRKLKEAKRRAELAARPKPVDRVRNAIHAKAQTQEEIQIKAQVGADELGDCLAILLLWNQEIKTRVIDGTRMYFPRFKVERFGPRATGVAA